MRNWRSRVARLATGGLLLGLLQGVAGISYNDVLFEFLLRWLSVLAAVLFGGDLSNLNLNNSNTLGA